MRDFFKSLWFKFLVVILAVLLGLFLFETSTGRLSTPSEILGTVIEQIERGTSAITNTVGGFFDQVVHSGQYKKENEQLREQLAQLQNQMVDYQELKTQNEQLKEIAGIKEKHSDYDMTPANVVARDPEQLYSFTINAGSLDDVQVNDPVITSAGLIGMVTTVGPTYSQVTTLLSPDLQVACYDIQTGESGIVSGRMDLAPSGRCQMQHMDKDTKVANGSLIATSGSSGIFPPGLIVGSVEDTQINENGISAYLVIQPSVDLSTVTDVTVIKHFEGQGSGIPVQQ